MQLNHETKTCDCTPAELAEGVQALHTFTIQGMVPATDKEFVNSLISQHQKKHSLSPKQAYWVFIKMQNAMGIKETPVVAADNGKRSIPHIERVFEMFAEAGKTLKKPGVVFPKVITDQGLKVYPGYKGDSINVVLKGVYPGKIGWITNTGMLNFKNNCNLTDEQKQTVRDLLKAFATSPAETVAHYGKLANRCCFCAKELTDPKSVDAGYGKTCAGNYGLPWG